MLSKEDAVIAVYKTHTEAEGAGLYSLGISKDSILTYETALKSDKFLLLAHGTAEELVKARDILQTTGPETLDTHSGHTPEMAGVQT